MKRLALLFFTLLASPALAATPVKETYSYQIPTTGFTITVPNYVNDLVLNPAGTLATGTITTPPAPADGQVMSISATQQVTALTLTANTGQTILGGVTSLAAGTSYKWVYNASLLTWMPVTKAPQLSGTFANKPSAVAGLTYYATDIGTNGCLLISNGTLWKPASGRCVLVIDGSAHTGAGTGAEANYATVTIPANLVSANGGINLVAVGAYTGTNGTKTFIVRHNTTSGAVTGGTILVNSVGGGSNTALSGVIAKDFWNNASQSAQVAMAATQPGYGLSSTSAALTGAINMANVSYLNFNMNGNASDTVGYQGIRVEWIEP